jgi:hypothetical protein
VYLGAAADAEAYLGSSISGVDAEAYLGDALNA